MVKVDLVTGFLGAGKTTFIREYIHYLKDKGEKIALIENEFGETSVDSELFKSELDEDCQISDLSGMCMCCIGKSAFIRMLGQAANTDCTRIIVEPSGIYDVDEFFDVMSDSRVSDKCEIGSIITIVDPFGKNDITSEAAYLMFSQLLASGAVVLSRTQFLKEEDLKKSLDWINKLLKEKGCEGGLMGDIYTIPWSELSKSVFEDIEEAGYYRVVHDREDFSHSSIFQSEEIEIHTRNRNEIEELVRSFFKEDRYGKVFRVKGFVRTSTEGNFEVNCTGSFMSCIPTEVDKNSLVIIGQHLKYRAFHPELMC